MTITTIFFDLDDTLYPAKSGLWNAIKGRINLYMHERLGIPADRVSALRREYFEQYGTTLLGLGANYPSMDVRGFLDFVHNVPLRDYIQPAPELRPVLEALPARKFIFTNGDANHVRRVLNALELDGCFDGILDILDMWPHCKPMPASFEMVFKLAGETRPQHCAMIDDLPRNTRAARQRGIFSILYGAPADVAPQRFAGDFPDADAVLTDWPALPALLEGR
ncbi:MAG: pyrimidine 5'-nucleotidase [Anaerolineales bacterium]